MREPKKFGDYVLLDLVSVGGMAEVFHAKGSGPDGFEKIVAIKRILPSLGEDDDFIKMFNDEATIAGQLSHPNIAQIFELGRHEESHFIAMEYIWGKDLLQIQRRFQKLGRRMPAAMACYILSKICEGLHYAHTKKGDDGVPLEIVHRDCSPQNILVSYEGEVKVIDFGIARAARRSSRTNAGVLKGKFGYMSPEQVRGMTLDHRSDVFALGTILWECLTGTRLFAGESDFSTLERVRDAQVRSPVELEPSVPKAVESIVFRALAREANDRYQTCAELNADLRKFLAGSNQFYTAKKLADWLKTGFAEDIERERKRLDEYKTISVDTKLRNDDLDALPTTEFNSDDFAGVTFNEQPVRASSPGAIELSSFSSQNRDDQDLVDSLSSAITDLEDSEGKTVDLPMRAPGKKSLTSEPQLLTDNASPPASRPPRAGARPSAGLPAPSGHVAMAAAPPNSTGPRGKSASWGINHDSLDTLETPLDSNEVLPPLGTADFSMPQPPAGIEMLGTEPGALFDPSDDITYNTGEKSVTGSLAMNMPVNSAPLPLDVKSEPRDTKYIRLVGLAALLVVACGVGAFLALSAFKKTTPSNREVSNGTLALVVHGASNAKVLINGVEKGEVNSEGHLTLELAPGAYSYEVTSGNGDEPCTGNVEVNKTKFTLASCKFAGGTEAVVDDAPNEALAEVPAEAVVPVALPDVQPADSPNAEPVELAAEEITPTATPNALEDVPLARVLTDEEELDAIALERPKKKKAAATKRGFLAAFSEPKGATIYVNGKNTGRKTPTKRLRLKPGTYSVKLELGTRKKTFPVTIKPGKTSTVTAGK